MIGQWRDSRYGTPRTERHYERYGAYDLPPRGAGRISGEYTTHFLKSVVAGIGFAVGAFLLYKLTFGKVGGR